MSLRLPFSVALPLRSTPALKCTAVLACLFAAWVGVLVGRPEIPNSSCVFLVLETFVLLTWVGWLAESWAERRIVAVIFMAGLLVYTLQVLLICAYPQLVDSHSYSDSFRYQRQALALAMHWRGQPVPTAEFRLEGLAARGVGIWPAGSNEAYGEILGVAAYPYSYFLGVVYWLTDDAYFAGIYANLPILAAIAVAVFLLAGSLTGSRRVAWVATVLIVLDPNLAVWGAVPLRDTHIALLSTLSLLAATRLARGQWSARGFLQGGAALMLLGLYRFNAAVAFCIAGLTLVRRLSRSLASAVLVASVAIAAVTLVPSWRDWAQQSSLGRLVTTHLQIASSAEMLAGITASTDRHAAPSVRIDRPRQAWHREFRQQPLWLTAIKVTTHTLMGPYPWVAWVPGVTGRNYYELMFPGMALWIICLPGLAVSVVRGIRQPQRTELFCYAWLVLVAATYVVGFGEFSGRARLMAMPLLWVLSANGLVLINDWLAARWSPLPRRSEVKGEVLSDKS